jgi:hypothetical protein
LIFVNKNGHFYIQNGSGQPDEGYRCGDVS